ncbi:ribosomal protein S30-domain-containing protein, partial [Lactarius quietus]
VHGSLARAGKVKSQTPKVEKQEKKKTPKGRAKKRMLYNRRFVNVTTLPGGKRRMCVLSYLVPSSRHSSIPERHSLRLMNSKLQA